MSDPVVTQIALHLLAAKHFQIAAFTMFMYDYTLTLSVEVEKIWNRSPSLGSALFLVNRYGTPLQYAAIINAFHDPRWTKELCDRYSVFEGASSVAMVGACELVMTLRVYALYQRSNYVLAVLLTLWTCQIVMSAVGLSTGFAIPLPPGLIGCIYTGTNRLFPCLWVTPLITDSVIFGLTIWRGRRYLTKLSGSPTNHIFVRDGAFFFLVIFLSNLMNTLIFFATKTEDLKPIAASFNQLLTSTMTSRLILNLRSSDDDGHHIAGPTPNDRSKHTRPLSHDIQFKSGTMGTIVTDVGSTRDERMWNRDTSIDAVLPDVHTKQQPSKEALNV